MFQIKSTNGELCKEPTLLITYDEGTEVEGAKILFAPVNNACLCEHLCVSNGNQETTMLSFVAADGWKDGGRPIARSGKGFGVWCFSGDGSLVHRTWGSSRTVVDSMTDVNLNKMYHKLPQQWLFAVSPVGRLPTPPHAQEAPLMSKMRMRLLSRGLTDVHMR